MKYTRKYYKEELMNNCNLQYHTNLENNESAYVKVNNSQYYISFNDNRIIINDFDNDKVNAFLFDSDNDDEIFTHYQIIKDEGKPIIISTIHSLKNEDSIIESSIASFIPLKKCVNMTVFMPELYLNAKPIRTYLNILHNNNYYIGYYEETDKVVISNINPYSAMIKLENNLLNRLNQERKR